MEHHSDVVMFWHLAVRNRCMTNVLVVIGTAGQAPVQCALFFSWYWYVTCLLCYDQNNLKLRNATQLNVTVFGGVP
jgi:hypothetical protein